MSSQYMNDQQADIARAAYAAVIKASGSETEALAAAAKSVGFPAGSNDIVGAIQEYKDNNGVIATDTGGIQEVPSTSTSQVYGDGKKTVNNVIPKHPDRWNGISGENDLLSVKGMLPGSDENGAYHTGTLAPIAKYGLQAYNTYNAYQNLQESRKMNVFNREAKIEAMNRQRADQFNKVSQMRRYAAIGMGSANSTYNTVAAVTGNPYLTYGRFGG